MRTNTALPVFSGIVKKVFLSCTMVCLCILTISAQTVYVDSDNGDDNNDGTAEAPVLSIHKAAEMIGSKDNDICVIKINPSIYILDKHVTIATEKAMNDKRIVIEASILPDDISWTPEQMPVIVNKSKKGGIQYADQVITSFLVEESHVTIRGIKFYGYFYPNSYYFPILRYNKEKTDLSVEQCMFVGDHQASHIQVGVIAHSDEIRIDHCIFYEVKNGVVFFQPSGETDKTGNSITNSIIFGANHAIWTSWPDKNFTFENNIISNCNYFWIKNYYNTTIYSINNSIITKNQHLQGVWHEEGIMAEEFEMNENNIKKEGEISLRLIESIDDPIPVDYLHVIPDTPGYGLGAGLFKHRKQ